MECQKTIYRNDERFTNSKSDETIIDVKRRFLSECTIPDMKILKKICSVPELDSNTNYDDICGPWKFDNVPLYSQYSYQPFTLITPEDVTYMRQQRDKKLILVFLGKNGYLKFNSKPNKIFTCLYRTLTRKVTQVEIFRISFCAEVHRPSIRKNDTS
jgi:hypothetical protein